MTGNLHTGVCMYICLYAYIPRITIRFQSTVITRNSFGLREALTLIESNRKVSLEGSAIDAVHVIGRALVYSSVHLSRRINL